MRELTHEKIIEEYQSNLYAPLHNDVRPVTVTVTENNKNGEIILHWDDDHHLILKPDQAQDLGQLLTRVANKMVRRKRSHGR